MRASADADRSGRSERLLDVFPQRIDGLEPDAQPQEVGRHAVALPAMPRLDGGRRPAEARGIHDTPDCTLDRSGVAADVEREEAAEAGVAHALHLRVLCEPGSELVRARRMALHAEGE